MSIEHWILILALAAAALSIRVLGLLAGDRIRASHHAWMLEELPGLIIVSLVASSLAAQDWAAWGAAAIALAVAWISNHVILTMCTGMAAFVALGWLIAFFT